MAWTLVAEDAGFSAPDSDTFTTAGITTTGANVGVAILATGNSATGTLSDSRANSWTLADTEISGFGKNVAVFYILAPSVGAAHTVTATGTDFFGSVEVLWFNESGGTPTFDGVNSNTTVFDSFVLPGSITPTANNALLVTGLCRDATTDSPSLSDSYTLEHQNNDLNFGHQYSAVAWRTQTTAAALNPTWTFPGGATLVANHIAFIPGGGGGGPTPVLDRLANPTWRNTLGLR